ncbi:hypothetical protein [Oryzihumus sp.]
MATRDLRFFGSLATEALPEGHPRRGISVVAALTAWLVHTNHRGTGSWTQRYEHGIPVTGLEPVAARPTTGTTVHFLPGEDVDPLPKAGSGAGWHAGRTWPSRSSTSVSPAAAQGGTWLPDRCPAG